MQESSVSVRRLSLAGLTIFVALLGVVFIPKVAEAHFLGEDSVDCSPGECSIKWNENSRWDGSRSWGIDQWNQQGAVSIEPDGFGSVEDLYVSDYSNCNTDTIAYWDGNSGADDLKYNNCIMSGASGEERRAVGVHEFGHALGLAHSYSDQIMAPCPGCNPYTTPQSHDINDYNRLWK